MKDDTRIINSDGYFDKIDGKGVKTVNPPLYNGSTLLFDTHEEMLAINFDDFDALAYGTERMPNQRAFEAAMQELEGGHLTRAFQSGIGAIINTILAFTKTGDHMLVVDSIYGPTARFCREVLINYGIETTFIPPDIGADIKDYLKANTKFILLESPASNTFEIQDIPAVVAVARERGIVTAIDNTWATPLYLKPFDLGVDISIQSITKYIAGHSDVLLGTVTVNEKHAETFARFYRMMELFAPSQECYLALRGLKTFPLRLKHHAQSAAAMIAVLQSNEQIDSVICPALPNHPQHEIWKRDFSGASGLFAFTYKKDYPQESISAFVNALELFGIGYSWGGYKSLITASKQQRSLPSAYAGKTIIRLSIGLEDPDDLLKDLEQAMKALG